jgi:uncharacterized protein YjiS (DUF1127 family)
MTYIQECQKPNRSRYITRLVTVAVNCIILKVRQVSTDAELARLNDHMLNDIGLTRDDIDHRVR